MDIINAYGIPDQIVKAVEVLYADTSWWRYRFFPNSCGCPPKRYFGTTAFYSRTWLRNEESDPEYTRNRIHINSET